MNEEDEVEEGGWGCAIAAILVAAAVATRIAVEPVIQIIHAVQGR